MIFLLLWTRKAFGRRVQKRTTIFTLFLADCIDPRTYYGPRSLTLRTLYAISAHFVPLGVCKIEKTDKDVKSPKNSLAASKKNHIDPLLSDTYEAFSKPLTSYLSLCFLLPNSLGKYSQNCLFNSDTYARTHVR